MTRMLIAALPLMLWGGVAMAQGPCFNGHPCELVPRDLPVGHSILSPLPVIGPAETYTRIDPAIRAQLDHIEAMLKAICARNHNECPK